MKLSIYAVGDKKEAYEDGIARRRAEVRIQLIKERRLYVDTAMLLGQVQLAGDAVELL